MGGCHLVPEFKVNYLPWFFVRLIKFNFKNGFAA